jgi:hypothetical protein
MELESRIEKHKKLLDDVMNINKELMDIQEQKFNLLVEFLEYEEALTTDKATAARIKLLLTSIGIWQTSTTQ